MQVVKQLIGGFFLLIIFLWLFAPKQELYYMLEKELNKNGIVISDEKFKDTLYGLEISDAKLFVKGIEMAKIKSFTLNIFFFYNTLNIESIKTDSGIHNLAPKSIDGVTALFNILNPTEVTLGGVGSFGEASGAFNLAELKLLIRVDKAKDIKTFRKFLKKDKKGYYYEKLYR